MDASIVPAATPRPLPAIGSTLAGKYRLDRVLGEGGMGVVYEAFHLRLKHRVAIKMLQPLALGIPDLVARFDREARAGAALRGPHVATMFDVDTSPEGLPFMVIEYLEGRDLSIELERRGPLPIDEAVALVVEACVPLAQAHGLGIIHRDLKPANLFLARSEEGDRLKLIDFGISKVSTDAARTTTPFEGLGTPHYMSPEQVRHAGDVDERADIWSLGVILYELLTGVTPFDGPASAICAAIVSDPIAPPSTIRRDIPPALEAIIMCALEKDRESRFQDVRSLASALAPFASVMVPRRDAPHSLVATSMDDLVEPPRRRRAVRAWMFLPVAASIALGVWAFALPSTAAARPARHSVMTAGTGAPAFVRAHAAAVVVPPEPVVEQVAAPPTPRRARAAPPKNAPSGAASARPPPPTNPLTL